MTASRCDGVPGTRRAYMLQITEDALPRVDGRRTSSAWRWTFTGTREDPETPPSRYQSPEGGEGVYVKLREDGTLPFGESCGSDAGYRQGLGEACDQLGLQRRSTLREPARLIPEGDHKVRIDGAKKTYSKRGRP